MAATLVPPAPPATQHRRSRAHRALALVFDALALAGATLSGDAPARSHAPRPGRFTRQA